MVDHVLAREAMRQRAASVVVCTTGLTTLSATALGFARSAGSFLTDGFADGMEVSGVGFNAGNNTPKIIEGQVTTGFLPIRGGCAVQAATAGRSLSVGIPQARQWLNTQLPGQESPGSRPYITDQWVPGASRLRTTAAPSGFLEETGLYVIIWYGLSNVGMLALSRSIEALRALFTPGTTVMAGTDAVTVRGNPGPLIGQIIPLSNGYATVKLEIPWRAYTRNVIAA